MQQNIQNKLFELQDVQYKEFQAKLLPTVDPDSIIGVRTPKLRAYAKELVKEDRQNHTETVKHFLNELPHPYFDENQLHAFLISLEKDFERCIEELETFLSYIDNWATCDQLSPKILKKHLGELEPYIESWLSSDHTYTVRFGIGVLMEHFLGESFDLKYPEMVASIRSDEYYINMMIAWYFATALAKQYDVVLPFITGQRLDIWTHNKAIQKCVESNRITPEQKAYLKTLKRKKD